MNPGILGGSTFNHYGTTVPTEPSAKTLRVAAMNSV